MTKGEFLGSFEQLILLALIHLGREAYGMTVRYEIERRAARRVSLGAVYATLDRLEIKGLVSSRTGDPAAERQGRARRFFQIEESGHRALQQALETLDRMRTGVMASPAWAPPQMETGT
jgi:PadR family transcriptional regulator, regulatory protein PadR